MIKEIKNARGLKELKKIVELFLETNPKLNELIILNEKLIQIEGAEYSNNKISPLKLEFVNNYIFNKLSTKNIDCFIDFIKHTEETGLGCFIKKQELEWWNGLHDFWKKLFLKQIGFYGYWSIDDVSEEFGDYHDFDSLIINEIKHLSEISIDIIKENVRVEKHANIRNVFSDDIYINFAPLQELKELEKINIRGGYFMDKCDKLEIINVKEVRFQKCDFFSVECLPVFKNIRSLTLDNCFFRDQIFDDRFNNALRDYFSQHTNLLEIKYKYDKSTVQLNVFKSSNLFGINKLYIDYGLYSKNEIIEFKKCNPSCEIIDWGNNPLKDILLDFKKDTFDIYDAEEKILQLFGTNRYNFEFDKFGIKEWHKNNVTDVCELCKYTGNIRPDICEYCKKNNDVQDYYL